MSVSSVASSMTENQLHGYRFPPEIIRQSNWLYLRFTRSFRDVEDLLAERYVSASHETVRRAVEGEVLNMLIQSSRNTHAALKLMRKLLKKYAFVPERMIADELRSYHVAARELGIENRHERGRRKNSRAENSHQPTQRRERKTQGLKSSGSARRFLSTHAAIYNTFHVQRHLSTRQTYRALRSAATSTWRDAFIAA